jgi:predicted MFS family arabinose efflux permease
MGLLRRVMAWAVRQLGGRASARVVAVFAAVFALDSADKGAVGAMAMQLQQGLGIGKTELGLLLTASSFAGAVGTVPFGWLVDRACRTRVLAFAVLVWGAAMLASAAATSYSHLLVTRLCLGVVTAAGVPAIASLTGDYFLPRRRGRMYGYILAGEFIGTGFGFVAAGELALLSWRAGFVALAVPALLVAWLLHRLPEPARGGADRLLPGQQRMSEPRTDHADGAPQAGDDDGQGTTLRDTLRAAEVAPREHLVFDENPGRKSLRWAVWYVLCIPTNLILIMASALGYYFFAGVRTFGVEFMHGRFGLSHSGAIGVAVLFGMGALVGVLGGGRLADHLLARGNLSARVLVATVAYLAAAVLLMPALMSHLLLVAVPALVLAALCFGAVNPPVDAARLDIMHPYLWGRAESIRAVLRLVAEALAPLLFGYTAEHLFGGGPLGLDRTFLVMLIPLFVSGAIGFIAFETYPRDVATAEAYTRRTEEQSAAGPPPGAAKGKSEDRISL